MLKFYRNVFPHNLRPVSVSTTLLHPTLLQDHKECKMVQGSQMAFGGLRDKILFHHRFAWTRSFPLAFQNFSQRYCDIPWQWNIAVGGSFSEPLLGLEKYCPIHKNFANSSHQTPFKFSADISSKIASGMACKSMLEKK